MMQTRIALGLAVLAIVGNLLSSVDAHAQDGDEDAVILIRASEGCSPWNPDERKDDAIYLASSANNWDPSAFRGQRVVIPQPGCGTANELVMWEFRVPAVVAYDRAFQFKFTRGSWATVEVGPDGRDIANRVVRGHDEEFVNGLTSVYFPMLGFADQRPARWPELSQGGGESTVTGHLDIFDFASEIRGNTRKIRVWTPPGYDTLELRDQRYPVLYMHDGQNLFDCATSFIGVEWGVDETLTELITSGDVPPMIVVGIDNAGEARADEYVPVPIGNMLNRRGGKADEYLAMLTQELMPMINAEFRTLEGPEHTFMGGSSFGGVITLHVAMTQPGMLGAILVESPALGVGSGAFLTRVQAFDNWPEHVFMAGGTKEGVFEGGRSTYPQMIRATERSMRDVGLDESRLVVIIEDGAEHNEAAWARRLPEAFRFLFADD